mmetsp:Transcript_45736/g.148678  ORF Transcript_45736/g.148678 Transcript_45736/m.148678 type:complete len:222 (-) Transcript_45736:52-717(-)
MERMREGGSNSPERTSGCDSRQNITAGPGETRTIPRASERASEGSVHERNAAQRRPTPRKSTGASPAATASHAAERPSGRVQSYSRTEPDGRTQSGSSAAESSGAGSSSSCNGRRSAPEEAASGGTRPSSAARVSLSRSAGRRPSMSASSQTRYRTGPLTPSEMQALSASSCVSRLTRSPLARVMAMSVSNAPTSTRGCGMRRESRLMWINIAVPRAQVAG